MTHTSHSVTASLPRRIVAGVVGGLAGGLIFGILMAMMGMLPMIASMVGSDSAALGFGIHLMISIGIGLGLTVLFGNWLLTSYPRGLVVGLVYGAVWWVLGPLIMMPLMLGMPLFVVDSTALLSLVGHLIYGAILGTVAVMILAKRR
ncbi:putative membrane protein YagU involved in acid resistance [Mycetocola sp. CAN_C7]|uniref:hypothetical protein n=1 Tax=Mycetocola sp. CAN_C7 TaxID=2787724 RepID=UPI001A22E79F